MVDLRKVAHLALSYYGKAVQPSCEVMHSPPCRGRRLQGGTFCTQASGLKQNKALQQGQSMSSDALLMQEEEQKRDKERKEKKRNEKKITEGKDKTRQDKKIKKIKGEERRGEERRGKERRRQRKEKRRQNRKRRRRRRRQEKTTPVGGNEKPSV